MTPHHPKCDAPHAEGVEALQLSTSARHALFWSGVAFTLLGAFLLIGFLDIRRKRLLAEKQTGSAIAAARPIHQGSITRGRNKKGMHTGSMRQPALRPRAWQRVDAHDDVHDPATYNTRTVHASVAEPGLDAVAHEATEEEQAEPSAAVLRALQARQLRTARQKAPSHAGDVGRAVEDAMVSHTPAIAKSLASTFVPLALDIEDDSIGTIGLQHTVHNSNAQATCPRIYSDQLD